MTLYRLSNSVYSTYVVAENSTSAEEKFNNWMKEHGWNDVKITKIEIIADEKEYPGDYYNKGIIQLLL